MGPWQKREGLCPQKKLLIPSRQQHQHEQLSQTDRQRGFKNMPMFFHANTIKQGQKAAKL